MLTWRAFNGTLNGKGTVDICIALMHWRDHVLGKTAAPLDMKS